MGQIEKKQLIFTGCPMTKGIMISDPELENTFKTSKGTLKNMMRND